MAWVEELPNGRWRGGYRLEDEKRSKRSKTFDHKKRALNWAIAQEEAQAQGSRKDPAKGRMRWEAWAEMWWPSRGLSEGARRSQVVLYNRFVLPRWGQVKLVDIQHLEIQQWVRELEKTVSASTTRQCFYQLSSSMKAAVRAGHIQVSPCFGVRLPAKPPGGERFMTDEEISAVVEAMPHASYRILAELLFETGMRISEAVALHVHRVDFARRQIAVVEQWSEYERLMLPAPKSKRQRFVPLSDHLHDVLQVHLATRPDRPDCTFDHAAGSVCRSPLVVVGPAGAVISPHNFSHRTWKLALRKAKVADARVHDARHSYASRLVTAGIPIYEVQAILGHDSVVTTERYLHRADTGHEAVRAALRRRR